MKKILILFAHPALQKSRVNKHLITGLQNMEGVTFHDLYQQYPDFDIDINLEQKLLQEHDVIIFHHPFFWYSTPAILKEWQDLVLEHGWAYGREGNALQDKIFFNIITTGGGGAAYSKSGFHKHTIKMLLAPIMQTAKLCKMVFLPPYVVHGTHSISKQEVMNHRKNIEQILTLLREEQIDINKTIPVDYLNDYLEKNKNA
jgi:glutathione-regulated potassium-efflux system ancillary protein KefG